MKITNTLTLGNITSKQLKQALNTVSNHVFPTLQRIIIETTDTELKEGKLYKSITHDKMMVYLGKQNKEQTGYFIVQGQPVQKIKFLDGNQILYFDDILLKIK